MKNGIIYLIVMMLFSISVLAQNPPSPPSPRPVADTEMRDPNSMRMREIQLERIKREANQVKWTRTNEESTSKFNEIKDDFENIQRL